MCVYLCWSDLKSCKKLCDLWELTCQCYCQGCSLFTGTHTERQVIQHDCLPIVHAGRWGQINWNGIYGDIGEEPRIHKNILYWHGEPNEPTKKGPLSFVLFESPLASVSTVNRGHPSLVSLSLVLAIMLPCEEEKKYCFHILCNCRSKDRTTSPLSFASTNEEDAGSEPAQVCGGNSCSFCCCRFPVCPTQANNTFNRPWCSIWCVFLFNCVIRSSNE